jgi:hypothetical protein
VVYGYPSHAVGILIVDIYILYNIPIKLAMPLCVYNLTFERDTHERKIMAYLRINQKSSNNYRCFGGSLTLIVALSTILIGK